MENKLVKKIGQSVVLVAAISALAIVLCYLVNFIISLVFDAVGIVSILTSLFSMSLFTLLGVGLLVSYINGKKGMVSSSGIMLVRVSVMIKGILSFVGFVLLTIVMVIGGFSVMALAFHASVGMGMLVLLIIAIIIALFVFWCIYCLKITLRINGTLGAIRSNREDQVKTKGMTLGSIMFMIYHCFGILLYILVLAAVGFVEELLYEIPGGEMIFDSIISTVGAGIIQVIIGIMSMIFMIIIYVCIIGFFNSFKNADRVPQMDIVPQPEVPAFDLSEEFGSTMILDEQPEPVVATGTIVSMAGEDNGYMYPIKDGDEYIIGKDARMCHIVIPEKYQKISRRHCGIRLTGDTYEVIDYSTNGTYIDNARRIEKGVYTRVPKGSVINLAKESISYRLG